jgi:hypothetical protein
MARQITSLLIFVSAIFCGIQLGGNQLEAQEYRTVARPQAGKARSFSLPVFSRASVSDENEEVREHEGAKSLEATTISGLEVLFEGGSSRSHLSLNRDMRNTSEHRQDPLETTREVAPFALPQEAIPQDPDRVGPTIGRRPLRRPLSEVNIDIHTEGKRLPDDRAQNAVDLDVVTWNDTQATGMVYGWEAPNIHYRKLYFEDVAVERYGQVPQGILAQEFRSAIHWGGTLLALPLNMRLDPYYDCDTPLGFCRPGDCVPPTYQRFLRR